MAQRRMFSLKVIGSARFLKMPIDSQCLYFHLGMNADDDGIVEAFSVLRMTGSAEDNLRVLVAKGFVRILNDDLVSHITDWGEHNLIRADRKVDSIYKNLLIEVLPEVQLIEPKPRADTKKTTGRPVDVQRTTTGRHRLGKDRLGKENINTPRGERVDLIETPKIGTLEAQVIDAFKDLNPSYKNLFKRKVQHEAARRLLELHGFEHIEKVLVFVKIRAHDRFCPSITTPVQLEEKWGLLEQYAAKLKGGTGKEKEIIGLNQ